MSQADGYGVRVGRLQGLVGSLGGGGASLQESCLLASNCNRVRQRFPGTSCVPGISNFFFKKKKKEISEFKVSSFADQQHDLA